MEDFGGTTEPCDLVAWGGEGGGFINKGWTLMLQPPLCSRGFWVVGLGQTPSNKGIWSTRAWVFPCLNVCERTVQKKTPPKRIVMDC